MMVISNGNWTNLMFEWSHKLRNKNQVAMFNVASFRKFAGFLDHSFLMLHLHGLAIVQQFIHQHHLATKSSTSPPKNPKNQFSLSMDLHTLLLAIFTELLSASHELTWWNHGTLLCHHSLQLDVFKLQSLPIERREKTDWKHQSNPLENKRMSPENHWLVQMYFLLK